MEIQTHPVLSASEDMTLKLWDIRFVKQDANESGSKLELKGHSGGVAGLSADFSARQAVSVSIGPYQSASVEGLRYSGPPGSEIRLWDLQTGQCLQKGLDRGGAALDVKASTYRTYAGSPYRPRYIVTEVGIMREDIADVTLARQWPWPRIA